MPAPAHLLDKNDLFAQYQILEDLGDFPSYSLFKVKAPNGVIKLWKKVDLQFNSASIETRLLPVIEKVQHPNLNAVSTSFLFQDKGLLFVESEFPVKTLRHRLDEIKSNSAGSGNVGIPVGELFSYIAQAADAIDFLNSAQHPYQGKKIAIYHRALSPDSLHLFEEKNKIICKVGDFGLAKPIIDNNEAARHSLGLTNYDYAPPEFDEGLTTNTSDQYSLATTYVELRTGRLPFTGSLLQKLQAQLSGNPDLSLLEPSERPVVARALSREPQARFPNCREFVRQLQQALGGVATLPVMAPTTRGNTSSQVTVSEPVAASAGGGGALFGSGNSGWALSAKPVGRSGGSLFNIQGKGPVNTPAKPEGFSLTTPSAQASAAPVAAPKAPVVPAARQEVKAPPAKPEPKVPPLKAEKAPAVAVPTPRQGEGWSLETPAEKPEKPAEPAISSNWTPGKVTAVSKGSSAGFSNPDISITPPPAAAATPPPSVVPTPPPTAPAKESMSTKAKETLELIKRKQAGPAAPPPPVVEKSVTGSKFLNISGSTALPPLPAAPVKPPPRGSRPAGALGETPAPPRPQNVPTPRRASTPNMGMPLPSRNQPSITARQAMKSPVPLPRSNSSTAGTATADPQQSLREKAAPGSGMTSLITLIMVSIAAFCIGMMLLFYFTKK
ncbi:MAG: protein kinase [Gemmatales bacterium]